MEHPLVERFRFPSVVGFEVDYNKQQVQCWIMIARHGGYDGGKIVGEFRGGWKFSVAGAMDDAWQVYLADKTRYDSITYGV